VGDSEEGSAASLAKKRVLKEGDVAERKGKRQGLIGRKFLGGSSKGRVGPFDVKNIGEEFEGGMEVVGEGEVWLFLKRPRREQETGNWNEETDGLS